MIKNKSYLIQECIMAAIIFLIVIAYFWKTIFLNLTFVTQDLNLFYYPIVAKISLMFKNGDLWFW